MKNLSRTSFKIFFTKILFALAVAFALTACTTSLDESTTNTDVPDGKCAVSIQSDLYARAALPTALPSGTVYGLIISYTDEDSTKYLTSEKVSDTLSFIEGTSEGEATRFIFYVPPKTATYTFTLYAFTSGTTLSTASQSTAFAIGTKEVTLEQGQKVCPNTQIELLPNTSIEGGGTGSVNLSISFGTITNIVASSITVTKDGTADSNNNNYGFTITLKNSSGTTLDSSSSEVASTGTLSAENVNSGTYLVQMSFYSNTEKTSEVMTTSSVQYITVYTGLTTDCWYINGKKLVETNETTGTVTPKALTLSLYDFTELFVMGTDAGDDATDGKLTFYTSSNFTDGVPTASDTTGNGSFKKPFATVQKAVDTIIANADKLTNKKYTIYLDGTFTGTDDDFSSSKECFVKISDAKGITLTIKGLSSTNKAVLNANRYNNTENTNAFGRVIEIAGWNNNFYLENMVITGGKHNCGGGIYATAYLNLKNTTVTKNYIGQTGGGGIYVGNAKVDIDNSTITENTAAEYAYGGGICIKTTTDISITANISNTVINKNSAAYEGGGICARGSGVTLTLTNTIVGEKIDPNTNGNNISKVATETDRGNYLTTTDGSGGAGISMFQGSSLTLKDSYVCKNYSLNNGGGIYASIDGDTTCTIENSVIGYNSAVWGGGIYIYNNESNASATITDSTICYNKATDSSKGQGGGLYSNGSSSITGHTLQINKGYIYGNESENQGGAIYNIHVALTVKGSKIYKNTAASAGGALYLYAGTATSASCTFEKYSDDSSGTSTNCELYNNSVTTGNGGALYNNQGTLNLKGCYIYENSANNGGGIYNYSGSTQSSTLNIGEQNETIKDGSTTETYANNAAVRIYDNSAKCLGGAIYAGARSTINFYSGVITENKITLNPNTEPSVTSYGGRAIYCTESKTDSPLCTFNMSGGIIQNNKMDISSQPSAGNGYAVKVEGNATFNFTGGWIGDNTSNDTTDSPVYIAKGFTLAGSAVCQDEIYANLTSDNYITVTKALAYSDNPFTESGIEHNIKVKVQTPSVNTTIVKGNSDYTLTSDDCNKINIVNDGYTLQYDSTSPGSAKLVSSN